MLIKVCGITREEDARLVRELGVDFCGFIFHKKSPRYVRPELVADLDTGGVKRVGVFVEENADEILAIMDQAHLSFAQLHGDQSLECAEKIGPSRVIRVLWPQRYGHRAQLYAAMRHFELSCACYLLDAGVRGGGSGQSFEWSDFSGMNVPHPWFLAGGLGPANIRTAIWESAPSGVDFNSGVEEAPGKKDREKVVQAVELVRAFDLHH